MHVDLTDPELACLIERYGEALEHAERLDAALVAECAEHEKRGERAIPGAMPSWSAYEEATRARDDCASQLGQEVYRKAKP